MERAFKGVWVPRNIWLAKDLTIMEKLFLVEIDSLDNEVGCYASNTHFSEFFDLSKNRCSEIIKSLEVKKKIIIEYEYGNNAIKKRIIKVVKGVFDIPNRVFGKPTEGIRKTEQGYSENLDVNNTSINNTELREVNALQFLEDNHPLEFESLMMKYQSKIQDFEKAKNDFNLQFDVENRRYELKIINSRAQLFFNRWIENDRKYKTIPMHQTANDLSENNPSRKRFQM